MRRLLASYWQYGNWNKVRLTCIYGKNLISVTRFLFKSQLFDETKQGESHMHLITPISGYYRLFNLHVKLLNYSYPSQFTFSCISKYMYILSYLKLSWTQNQNFMDKYSLPPPLTNPKRRKTLFSTLIEHSIRIGRGRLTVWKLWMTGNLAWCLYLILFIYCLNFLYLLLLILTDFFRHHQFHEDLINS